MNVRSLFSLIVVFGSLVSASPIPEMSTTTMTVFRTTTVFQNTIPSETAAASGTSASGYNGGATEATASDSESTDATATPSATGDSSSSDFTSTEEEVSDDTSADGSADAAATASTSSDDSSDASGDSVTSTTHDATTASASTAGTQAPSGTDAASESSSLGSSDGSIAKPTPTTTTGTAAGTAQATTAATSSESGTDIKSNPSHTSTGATVISGVPEKGNFAIQNGLKLKYDDFNKRGAGVHIPSILPSSEIEDFVKKMEHPFYTASPQAYRFLSRNTTISDMSIAFTANFVNDYQGAARFPQDAFGDLLGQFVRKAVNDARNACVAILTEECDAKSSGGEGCPAIQIEATTNERDPGGKGKTAGKCGWAPPTNVEWIDLKPK